IPILPGSWYNGGFMKKLATNLSGSGFSLLPPWQATGTGNNIVFGNNGVLSARVNSLVAVFGKTVEITMQSSTYNSIASQWQTAANLNVGCFSFSGSAGGSNFKAETAGNLTKLTIKDTSSDPQIIGVTLAYPGISE